MTQVAETLQGWTAALEQRPTAGPAWLEQRRSRAASAFAGLGFPTVRQEEWRFTSVAPIANGDFPPAPAGASLDEAQLAALPYADAPHRLVLVNGRVSPALSRLGLDAPGVRFGSLAGALDDIGVAETLGRIAEADTRAFAALNTAFLEDGAYLYVPARTVVETPLEILYVTSSASPVMTSPRTLIVMGEASQARVVETYIGVAGQVYFTNAVSEVFLAPHAVLDHYKVQQESVEAHHVASLHLHAERSSTFASHSFSLGGRIVRNDAVATLAGEGAECTLNGLYLADGERLVDNHTFIDHAMPHCPSHEVYKGILGGRARAVFNGKIMVREDAQKTDAKQTNRALLLSDEATINTKPQLEIFADDVKCTHGAAIGQLDEDAIFYLQARGLTYLEARDLLIHAFAGEILDRVQIAPLKAALERELYTQLARDLAEIDRA
jgi:Fe-S cluster assembly protein SufD